MLAPDDSDDVGAVRRGRAGLALDPPPRVRGSLLRLVGVAVARIEDAPGGRRLLEESLDVLDGAERLKTVHDLLVTLDLGTEHGAGATALVDERGSSAPLTPVEGCSSPPRCRTSLRGSHLSRCGRAGYLVTERVCRRSVVLTRSAESTRRRCRRSHPRGRGTHSYRGEGIP